MMEMTFAFGFEDGVLGSTLVFQDEHRKHNSRPVGGDGMFRCFQGAQRQLKVRTLGSMWLYVRFTRISTFVSLIK